MHNFCGSIKNIEKKVLNYFNLSIEKIVKKLINVLFHYLILDVDLSLRILNSNRNFTLRHGYFGNYYRFQHTITKIKLILFI